LLSPQKIWAREEKASAHNTLTMGIGAFVNSFSVGVDCERSGVTHLSMHISAHNPVCVRSEVTANTQLTDRPLRHGSAMIRPSTIRLYAMTRREGCNLKLAELYRVVGASSYFYHMLLVRALRRKPSAGFLLFLSCSWVQGRPQTSARGSRSSGGTYSSIMMRRFVSAAIRAPSSGPAA